MNDIQDITVSGDFLLITVSGRRFFFHQLFNSCVGGDDTFDCIRCLGTLHFCNLHELFQFLRTLLQILFLFAGFFIDGCYISKDVRVPFLFSDL